MGKNSRDKKENKFQENKEIFSPKKSALEKISFAIVEWGIYISLFAPLVIVRSYFFPYVSPKSLFFRMIIDIVFIAYILLIFFNRKYLPRFNALTISITIFLAVAILTSITGVNFERSFWSVFERMTGVLTFLHLYVFFIILTSVFKEKKYWERFLSVSIVVGLLEVFYIFFSKESTAQGGGTIGNTSFLSAYLLFNVFFAIIFILIKKRPWRIFYGLALIPLAWELLFRTKEPTKGAISAFIGGMFILFFGYFLFYSFKSGKKILKRLAVILMALMVLGGFGFSQTSFFKKEINSIIHSTSWKARAVVWKMGFEAWKERPWLGWGQENFNIPFAKYFDPTLPSTGDIWYDRVHNIIFDTLVAGGIVGLLSYLAIFGTAIVSLFKIAQRVTEKRNLFLPLGMIALLAAYFAQNFWVFDMISSYLMFFLILAFIYFLIEFEKPKEDSDKKGLPAGQAGIPSFIAAPLIIVGIFTFYFGNVQPSRASRYIIQGISSPLENAIPIFQKAIKTSPMAIAEVPEQFSRMVTSFIFNEKMDQNVLKKGFELSIQELQKSIQKSPLDFRTYLILGREYNDFYQFTGDQEKLKSAEEILQIAKGLSPHNQQVYWSLAQTKLSQGDNDQAIAFMQKSADLDPNFLISQWYLAMTYKLSGKYELALQVIKDAESRGFEWKSSMEYIRQIIEIYEELKDDKALIELYSLAIEKSPTETKFWVGLAVAYANISQFDKARISAQKALELNPSPELVGQLQNFLNSLPAQ